MTIPGFKQLTHTRRQTCATIFAADGHGKTTFACRYCPDPVALINFDGRFKDAVADAMSHGQRVFYDALSTPVDISKGDSKTKDHCKKTIARFFKSLDSACAASKRGKCRTICIDTGTEFDIISRLAIRGHLQKGDDFGQSGQAINQMWFRIFETVRQQSEAHLILLARAAEKWLGKKPQGYYVPKGNSALESGCDWAGYLQAVTNEKAHRLDHFRLTITKAGVNAACLGNVYKQKQWESKELALESLESRMGDAIDNDDEEEISRVEKLIDRVEFSGQGFGPFAYACERLYVNSKVEDWL